MADGVVGVERRIAVGVGDDMLVGITVGKTEISGVHPTKAMISNSQTK